MRRPQISPAAYRLVTVAAVAALGAIIVTGAAVRLTDSGMGCPTWPNCEDGSMVPRGATGIHGWVEYGNRLFTGAVSVAVALAVLGAIWRVPYRRELTRWALGLVAGVFAQVLLGGLVVWLHVAPIAVMGHYLLSAVLVWNAIVLHHKASQPETGMPAAAPMQPQATTGLVQVSRGVVGAAALVLVTGTVVTGSGPHGGDEAADRLDLAVSTAARVHGAAVWVFLVLTVLVLWMGHRGDADRAAMGRAKLLVWVIVAQATIGYVQYLNDVPELLVAAHVLGSVVVWIAALRFHLGLSAPAVLPVGGSDPEPVSGLVGANR